jgi:hypothetical protein
MSEKFERWFQTELTQRGYDADVCTGYLTSLLDSDEDIQEWLQEMGNLEQDEIQQFNRQILDYYRCPETIPELKVDIDSDQYQELMQDVQDLLTEAQPIEPTAITVEEPMIETLPSVIDETEGIDDLLLEADDTVEMIDYVTLASELEWYLSNADPILVCSTESILESIFCTNGNLTESFALLEYNHQLCCSAPQSRPCRHFIQSGKCLRSDCFFDHSFATKTCKFWLTTGCLSADCLFLHQLVLPERSLSDPMSSGSSPALSAGFYDFPELISSSSQSQSQSQSQSEQKRQAAPLSQSMSYKSALKTRPSLLPPLPPSSDDQQRATRREIVSSISSASIAQNLWVESGQAVCANYQQTREEARALAIARNKLLEEATQAYLRSVA